jgi:nitrate reductase delta subunit
MARLSRAQAAAGIDRAGELPDHLAPILRYLASTTEPMPEVIEVLGPAVERMLVALRRAEPANPYVDLLSAVQAAVPGPAKENA